MTTTRSTSTCRSPAATARITASAPVRIRRRAAPGNDGHRTGRLLLEADDNAGCASGDGPFDPVTGRSLARATPKGSPRSPIRAPMSCPRRAPIPATRPRGSTRMATSWATSASTTPAIPASPPRRRRRCASPTTATGCCSRNGRISRRSGRSRRIRRRCSRRWSTPNRDSTSAWWHAAPDGCVYGTGTQQSLYIPENPSY